MTDRSAYVDKMKAKVDEWSADIEKMQAKAKGAQADARIEYGKQLDEMRKMRDEAQAKMKEAQHASDDAWDDMSKGFQVSSLSSQFLEGKQLFWGSLPFHVGILEGALDVAWREA